MLSSIDYVKGSLDTHLFFGRIMKEHSFFLQAGFTSRDAGFIRQADAFRQEFDRLLSEAASLSNGVVDPMVIQSGEVVTPYTANAEMLSSFYTGIQIPTALTQAETGLAGGGMHPMDPMLEQRVFYLNQRYIETVSALINFKTVILSNVLSCRMFTMNYPLLIDHILREAKLYLATLQRLQRREEADLTREAYEQEVFWNRIMAEHSKFIRGLLDPTEEQLIHAADDFGKEFDQLTNAAKAAMDQTLPLAKVTNDSIKATMDIKNFNAQGTQGLIGCKVKSIIIPLLGDHVLRESSHFLRLLESFKTVRK